MGFGKKTDYATGRVLDLDKSYSYIIKPAAEEAGIACKRADEIVHSGTIDVPMFEQLLTADVVIADVSTSNPNAFYELGVRLSGVNYFFALTTTISPYQRQLLCNSAARGEAPPPAVLFGAKER
jgi:hypothetical protein